MASSSVSYLTGDELPDKVDSSRHVVIGQSIITSMYNATDDEGFEGYLPQGYYTFKNTPFSKETGRFQSCVKENVVNALKRKQVVLSSSAIAKWLPVFLRRIATDGCTAIVLSENAGKMSAHRHAEIWQVKNGRLLEITESKNLAVQDSQFYERLNNIVTQYQRADFRELPVVIVSSFKVKQDSVKGDSLFFVGEEPFVDPPSLIHKLWEKYALGLRRMVKLKASSGDAKVSREGVHAIVQIVCFALAVLSLVGVNQLGKAKVTRSIDEYHALSERFGVIKNQAALELLETKNQFIKRLQKVETVSEKSLSLLGAFSGLKEQYPSYQAVGVVMKVTNDVSLHDSPRGTYYNSVLEVSAKHIEGVSQNEQGKIIATSLGKNIQLPLGRSGNISVYQISKDSGDEERLRFKLFMQQQSPEVVR